MKLMACGIVVFLLLYTVPMNAAVAWSPMKLTEQSPLVILQIPSTIDVSEGTVTGIDVVVGNRGLEALNVTLSVEQDRSPHEAITAEPLPTAIIDAESNATLVLKLLGVISDYALNSTGWIGSVSTSIFVRAMTVDGNASSDVVNITVHISFLRLTITVFAVPGVIIFLVSVVYLIVQTRRHVENKKVS